MTQRNYKIVISFLGQFLRTKRDFSIDAPKEKKKKNTHDFSIDVYNL